MKTSEVRPYAVVFSGGGALGAWEVGCFQAVLEHHRGTYPKVVTGASAGAINAAGICAGMNPAELSELWAGLTNDDVYRQRSIGWPIFQMAVESIFKGPLRAAEAQIRKIESIFDTRALEKTLTAILEPRDKSFLQSDISIVISATKLTENRPELFYKLPPSKELTPPPADSPHAKAWTRIESLALLIQALMGTTALPLLFPPLEGHFDGGVLLNQPISPAIYLGVTDLYVFVPSAAALGRTQDILQIGSTVLSTWLAASLLEQIEKVRIRNIIRSQIGDSPIRICLVRPGRDLGIALGVGLLSFGDKVTELVELGYKNAIERLQRFDPDEPKTWYHS